MSWEGFGVMQVGILKKENQNLKEGLRLISNSLITSSHKSSYFHARPSLLNLVGGFFFFFLSLYKMFYLFTYLKKESCIKFDIIRCRNTVKPITTRRLSHKIYSPFPIPNPIAVLYSTFIAPLTDIPLPFVSNN